MAITTPADPRWASNTGNSYYTVDPGTAADNIFVFANGSEKIRYVPDGPYRAIATAYGGGDVTSRLQAVLDHASVKEVLVDTQAFTISGTLTIPAGKVLSFAKGGSLAGSGTIVGAVRADYDQNIFAQTLTTTNVSSATGKVSLEWWTPAGDGTTSDQTAITKAFGTLTKHVIMGSPSASKNYNIANSGTYTGFGVGTIAEFLPNTKVKPTTGNLVSFGCRIIASDTQHIIEVTDAAVRLSTPEDSGNPRISCRWTGCQGDDVTDDTIPMQVAANWAANRFSGSANTRVELYLPPGKYLCDNVQLLDTVRGSGRFTTVQAFTSGEYALIASQNIPSFGIGSWVPTYMSDFGVQGNFVSNGIKFGNLGADDQDVGKWVFERMFFNECITAVYKPAGNIGNRFENCSFTFGDYHYYATANVSPVMHTGNDTFVKCHFRSAQKACVYVSQSSNGGDHQFIDCIWEYNPGYAIYIAEYGNALFPFKIHGGYMEGNATAGSVEIDSVTQAPVNIYINSAKPVIIEECATKTMRVRTASVVYVSKCNAYIDDADLDVDSSSVVLYDKMYGFTIDNSDLYHITPPVCDPDSSALARFNIGRPTVVRMPGDHYVTSRSCQSLQPTGGGFPSGASAINIADDGLLYPKCWEVQSGATSTIQVTSSVSITAASFVVCQVGLKKISGTGVARVQFVNAAGADYQTESTTWKYFTQILYTGAGSSSYALAHVGDVVYRVSCLQIHVFPTYQAAWEFCHKNQFASLELPYGLDVGYKGGRTLVGGNDTGDDLTLSSTSYPTKGDVNIGSSGNALTVHEADNSNVSHGQNTVWNIGANTTNYRVFTGSDISNGGSVAHYVFEFFCSQRDGTGGNDATKILGRFDWFNGGSTVPSASRHAGRILFRADGGTLNGRGGRFEIWNKANNVNGVAQVFAIDNAGKVYIILTPTTAASGHYPLYRNSSTGEITQGATVAAVDSVDKFTLTATGSRTITTGETLLYIHLKSDASITVDIGTSAAGTDIATGMALTSGQTKILAVPMTADSTITVHFTYTSGTGNIDVIHVKKIY